MMCEATFLFAESRGCVECTARNGSGSRYYRKGHENAGDGGIRIKCRPKG